MGKVDGAEAVWEQVKNKWTETKEQRWKKIETLMYVDFLKVQAIIFRQKNELENLRKWGDRGESIGRIPL